MTHAPSPAEHVKNLLLLAFPRPGARADAHDLTHAECMLVSDELVTLMDADLLYYLPQILIDLIGTHAAASLDLKSVGMLIQFLDGSAHYPMPRSSLGFEGGKSMEKAVDKIINHAIACEESLRSPKHGQSVDITRSLLRTLLGIDTESLEKCHLANGFNMQAWHAGMLRTYDLFDGFQSYAIYRWLRISSTWSEFSIFSEQLKQARLFWSIQALIKN